MQESAQKEVKVGENCHFGRMIKKKVDFYFPPNLDLLQQLTLPEGLKVSHGAWKSPLNIAGPPRIA